MTTETPQPGPDRFDTQSFGPPPTGQQYFGYPPPPPSARRSRRGRRTLIGIGAAALAAGLVASGVAIGDNADSSGSSASSIFGGSSSTDGSGGTAQGYQPAPSTGSTSGAGTAASAKQQVGIVTINSVLKYQNAESAGTGMVLSADGEILTNNHVIAGATSITVTVETTGKSYRAEVVGTDATDDVAVLQLKNASGLATAKLGDASDVGDVSTGDTVTGVGNAGGTGTLTAATGRVTALEQTITASDETGAGSETLDGLIETNAAIISGDSGGPLYDSDGDIVGINTAASTNNAATAVGGASVAAQAYAIPITDAMTIAAQIESGIETSSVRIGPPAFLGVGLADATGSAGAAVGSVVSGGPADDAGIAAGSVITAVGGKAVSSASTLQSALDGYDPGDRVSVSWSDASGSSRTATVTLGTGPAA